MPMWLSCLRSWIHRWGRNRSDTETWCYWESERVSEWECQALTVSTPLLWAEYLPPLGPKWMSSFLHLSDIFSCSVPQESLPSSVLVESIQGVSIGNKSGPFPTLLGRLSKNSGSWSHSSLYHGEKVDNSETQFIVEMHHPQKTTSLFGDWACWTVRNLGYVLHTGQYNITSLDPIL